MDQPPQSTPPALPASDEAPSPAWVGERLAELGVQEFGETALRRLLEGHAPAFTLYRLPPAAARKWRARYRIMLGPTYLDCQSAEEAYARAYLVAKTGFDGPTEAKSQAPSDSAD